LQSEIDKSDIVSSKSNLKIIPTVISSINFISPTRDIPTNYSPIYSNSILPENCCNDICGVFPNNSSSSSSSSGPLIFNTNSTTSGSCIPAFDPFGNEIKYVATYGTDERQKYFIYRPPSINANTSIVVLIHGGGWFSGPNPNNVSGYPFKFAQKNDANNNLVNSLLDSNFIVVSLLYRLVPYGDNNNEITTTGVTIQNQVDDVDMAIQHIRNNFPVCLGVNANSIQIVGESAGGQLALAYAYTKSNTNYVKSVISMYAPTNMYQYSDSLKTKKRIHNCGDNFYFYSPWGLYPNRASHYPAYFYISNIFNPNEIQASVNPLNCITNIVYSDSTNINNLLPSGGANDVRIDAYKLIQSGFHQININQSDIQNVSPVYLANSTRNIPTFIMHGNKDALVRYEHATHGMRDKLSTLGGIDSLPGTTSNINFNSTNRHLLKIYSDANHTFTSAIAAETSSHQQALYARVRKDIVDWLSNKK
jgi:acetyl esterase/lipase